MLKILIAYWVALQFLLFVNCTVLENHTKMCCESIFGELHREAMPHVKIEKSTVVLSQTRIGLVSPGQTGFQQRFWRTDCIMLIHPTLHILSGLQGILTSCAIVYLARRETDRAGWRCMAPGGTKWSNWWCTVRSGGRWRHVAHAENKNWLRITLYNSYIKTASADAIYTYL